MHKITNFLKEILKRIYRATTIIDKSAIFVSHPDFSDNIYPLYLELKKIGYKCLWVLYNIRSKRQYKEKGIRFISFRKSLRNIFILSRYHYVFYSHLNPIVIQKENQLVYICWHGSPFKMYRGGLINNVQPNYFFVPSSEGCLNLYKEKYSDSIELKRSIPYRHFRTDLFIDSFHREEKNRVIEYFKINTFNSVTLCCLTWIRDKERNFLSNKLLGIDLSFDDLMNLDRHLMETNSFLIVKPHPGQKNIPIPKLNNIKLIYSEELTLNKIQLYSLIAASDKLITDYSSILFDYCLLDKPVGHIIHDWNYFINNDREQFIYENPEELMYGTRIHNLDELIAFIQNPKPNNDKLRNEINNKYNSDPLLKESSTLKFIKEVLHEEI